MIQLISLLYNLYSYDQTQYPYDLIQQENIFKNQLTTKQMRRLTSIQNRKTLIKPNNILTVQNQGLKYKNLGRTSPISELVSKQKKESKQKQKQNIMSNGNFVDHHINQKSSNQFLENKKHFIKNIKQNKVKQTVGQNSELFLSRKGLRQCQIHLQKPIPSPEYLVEDINGEDFLCCQLCKNKLSSIFKITPIKQLRKKSHSQHNHIGFSQITQQINRLVNIKQNYQNYQEIIKKLMKEQVKAHENYYGEMIKIIKNAQKQSEMQLKKYAIEAEERLYEIKNQINNSIKCLKDIENQRLNFNESVKLNQQYTLIKQIKKSHQNYILNIGFLQFQPNIQVLQEFQNIFRRQFQIKFKPNEESNLNHSLSSQKESLQDKYYYPKENKTINNPINKINLYCDQELGHQTKPKINQGEKPFCFSFQKIKDYLPYNNNYQEDQVVVSPSFKQF